MTEVAYILGHSEHEIRRLTLQASIIEPITKRLLTEAGLARGMRVLDLGTGCGDVAMLAAEMVGPSGTVVGIDRSPEALAVSRERGRKAGHANLEFRQGAAEDFVDPVPFDLVVGRYVLIHQADPAAFIRAAASHVRPGGRIAFHEISIRAPDIFSTAPLYAQVLKWLELTFRSALPHIDAPSRLNAHFVAAGLKRPSLFGEVTVGCGPDSPIFPWIALSMRNVLPQLEKIGAATAAEVDIETLEERLREAVTMSNSQIHSFPQMCAWTSL
jgi:ubiquinone/menaquinone biosynthesis C-methylase UbiE